MTEEASTGLGFVWALFAVVAVEIVVTYARVPAAELYHVSGGGLEGGASRALVFANFPAALVALAVLGLLFEGLDGRAAKASAIAAAVASAAVFWPGIVRQSDLDARPVNAVAAIGVAVALVLTLLRPGAWRWERRAGDGIRLGIAVVALAVSLPWVAADLGFYLDGVPVLGSLFQTGVHAAVQPELPTVHHGHHHGLDGLLLVLSVLVLSRGLPAVRRNGLRAALAAYLALMLCYGVGNLANDLWIEQVWKRGWTSWQIPGVLEPRPTIAWLVIVACTVAVWLAWARRDRAASHFPNGV